MASKNSITNFKSGFGGGTRANRFRVTPIWPTASTSTFTSTGDSAFKIVSASLPATQVNTIVVPYRGRQITYPGDRIYSTWAVGIYDDNDTTNLWKSLHRWSEAIDGHFTHRVQNNDFSFKNYQTTWKVEQLSPNGNTIKTIYLYKCWPSVIGEISLNMAETGFVGFSATLTFDYLRIDDNFND